MVSPVHVLTVRFRDPAGDPAGSAELRVRGTVDQAQNTVTYELPDQTTTTLDVVTARALQMVLWEAVFGSLKPNGPFLRIEKTVEDSEPAA